MRTIKRTSAFKKDLRRAITNPKYAKAIQNLLGTILNLLANDKPLERRFNDHNLVGNWSGYRECHVKPDLLLIYKITDDGLDLILARLGSHSDLFK